MMTMLNLQQFLQTPGRFNQTFKRILLAEASRDFELCGEYVYDDNVRFVVRITYTWRVLVCLLCSNLLTCVAGCATRKHAGRRPQSGRL